MAKLSAPRKKLLLPIRRVDAEGTITYKLRSCQYHREDGPALECVNGHKEWWIKGFQHRVDGPAIITEAGNQYWMQNGLYHREDGPALVYANGARSQYYLENIRLDEKKFFEVMRGRKMAKALESLEKFTDKFGKGKTLNEAGLAVMKFLQGECDHSFQTKDKTCELCDSQ